MTISFRKRTGLWKLIGKKPLADLHIGDPLLPDTTLSVKEATDKKVIKKYYNVVALPIDLIEKIIENIELL